MWITQPSPLPGNEHSSLIVARGIFMKMKFNVFFAVILFTSSYSFAKANSTIVPSSRKASAITDKALIEELTGKKNIQQNASTQKLKNAPLPVQHYLAGKKAAQEKNYILAIKHFNTVLKKYPQSAQVSPTLVAKAKVYQEMGLMPQAAHNMRIAQLKAKANIQSGLATKSSEKTKAIK